MIFASGVTPSACGLRGAHDDDRGGAVVERAAVAGGDPAVRAEDRLEPGDALQGDARARTVVCGHNRAVGQCHRSDLAGPEAVRDSLLGEVLRPYAELIHLFAGHVVDLGQILGGLTHGEVDVGHVAAVPWICPRWSAGTLALLRAGVRLVELRVLPRAAHDRLRLRRETVRVAADESGHRLHAGGEEHVALARLDGVEGHPGGLQRRGAVAGQRGAGEVVVSHEHRDHAGHVEALLTAGQAAAEVEVVDVARVKLGHLVERGRDDGGREVIGAQRAERSLEGAADRGSSGGDDDGVIRIESGHTRHVTAQY